MLSANSSITSPQKAAVIFRQRLIKAISTTLIWTMLFTSREFPSPHHACNMCVQPSATQLKAKAAR